MTKQRRKRHTPEQIVKKLREADAMPGAGKDLTEVLRGLEVSEATWHRWRNGHRRRALVRRDEVGGGQTTEGTGARTPGQEAAGRGGTGQGDAPGDRRGKLVSPSRRRAAVKHLQTEHDASERRACRVLGQPRSTQRYASPPQDDEVRLTQRLRELSRAHPRYGYRRTHALLRAEGWSVNRRRIRRLWRREGLKLPGKQRRRRAPGSSDNACHRRRFEKMNDVGARDFVFSRTTSGSQLKWLSIVDEYTRECLVLKVARRITAEDVIDTLAELFAMRGVPWAIRSDNGPEFVARAIRTWLARLEIEALYVEPGSPWEARSGRRPEGGDRPEPR